MDLKQYFRKIQAVESSLSDEYPIVVSLETADGGKEGRISEVSRSNAAVMVVEGRAVLATEEQKQQFAESQAAARTAHAKAEAAKRLQVAIISESDLGHMTGRKNSQNK
jgi:hypothetical protein